MQKLLTNYTQVILWTTIVLLLATPVYVAYDLFFRQPAQVEAVHEDLVKKGSYLFAANQCWRCHGYNGEGGIGLPLTKTQEIVARDDKDPFIIKTIARGRRGTQMPAWAKEEGGPLDIEDIKALREFIRDGTHWGEYYDEHPVVVENNKIVEGKLGVKAWKKTQNYLAEHALLPPCEEKDVACKGKQVFSGPCQTCHNITAEIKPGILAPGLLGIFQKDKLPNGKPVNDDNVREWIKKGSASYKTEQVPPFMPPYQTQVADDQITQLIAFLKTLTK